MEESSPDDADALSRPDLERHALQDLDLLPLRVREPDVVELDPADDGERLASLALLGLERQVEQPGDVDGRANRLGQRRDCRRAMSVALLTQGGRKTHDWP